MKTYQAAVPLFYQGKRYYKDDLALALSHLAGELEAILKERNLTAKGKPKAFVRYTAMLDEVTLEHRYDTYYVLEVAAE